MTAQSTPGKRGPKGPQACYTYDAERHRRHVRFGCTIPAKPVLDPEGRRFDSMGEAAAAYGLTRQAVSYRARVRTGGWRFADDAP